VREVSQQQATAATQTRLIKECKFRQITRHCLYVCVSVGVCICMFVCVSVCLKGCWDFFH